MLKVLFIICYLLQFILAKDGKNIMVNEVVEEKREMEKLITDILLNTLKPYKCVAILCDSVYYNVLREDIFLNLGLYISYFIILVEDHDDLLSPYPDTQIALNYIKLQDCQTYIILIANGIQMSRLLRYGDRYRVLDTRVNFVMIYDNRLFEKDLHYLWKRIVNVIFIREYTGVKKIGGEKKIIPWFELSTVPFPSPIKGILLPRRLDIWRQNKFRTGADLFRDKTSDLRNQTVKVATFQHVPAATKTAIPEYKTAKSVLIAGDTGFTGIEIEILSTVSQNMNFFPELYQPENADTEFWGNKQPDGQYSGMFGELIESRADIGLGDFYYTPQILDIMDLTLPYNTECLTFATPEALTDNSWKTLILPFKPLMWTGVILSMIICAILLYYFARFHYSLYLQMKAEEELPDKPKLKSITVPLSAIQKMNPNAKYTLMMQQFDLTKPDISPDGLSLFNEIFNSFLYTYSMVIMVSLPKLPNGLSLRLLIGIYWIYTTLVVVAYRASMTAILANPAPRVTIDTLEELVESKLQVGSWGEINRDFFMTSLDPLGKHLGNNFEIINDTDIAIDRVATGKFALYDNTHYLKQVAVKRQFRAEMAKANGTTTVIPPGDRNIHIMSNCVIKMPISIGMQKNSPIKPRVDKFIRRVIEAGLITKWLDDVMASTLNAQTTVGDATKPIMSTDKFFGAVVVLFIGYFLSLSTFIGEMIYFHKFVKTHPNFDKYFKTIIHDKT